MMTQTRISQSNRMRALNILFFISLLFTCYAQDIETMYFESIEAFSNGDYKTALSQNEAIYAMIKEQHLENDIIALAVDAQLITLYAFENRTDKAIKCYDVAMSHPLYDMNAETKLLVLKSAAHLLGSATVETSISSKIETEMLKMIVTDTVSNLFKWELADCLSGIYLEQERYDDIIELGNIIEPMFVDTTSLTPTDSIIYRMSRNSLYMTLGRAYCVKTDYSRSLLYFHRALDTDVEHEVKAVVERSIASAHYNMENYDKAVDYQNIALSKLEQEEDSIKARQYYTLAEYLIGNDNYNAALQYFLKAEPILEVLASPMLQSCIAMIYDCYFKLGDVAQSQFWGNKLADIVDLTSTEDDEYMKVAISGYAQYQRILGDNKEALDAFLKGREIGISLYGENNPKLFETNYSISSVYLEQSKYDEALLYVERCLACIKDDVYKREEFILAILLKASILTKQGYLGEGTRLCESLYDEVELLPGSSSTKASFYDQLGYLYGELGDYKTALKYQLLVDSYNLDTYGKQSPKYANSQDGLAALYSVIGENKLAQECRMRALEIKRSLYGENSKEYYYTYRRGLIPSDDIGRQRRYLELVQMSKNTFGEESTEYADRLFFYGFELGVQNNTDDGISKMEEALSIKQNLGEDKNVLYLYQLSWLSAIYRADLRYDKIYGIGLDIYEKVKSYVKLNFVNLNEQQRATIWDQFSTLFDDVLWLACEDPFPAYNKLALNILLLRKGLLLEANRNTRLLALKSGDQQLIALDNEINDLKNVLISSREENKDKMQEQLIKMQREELTRLSTAGSVMEFVDVDWTDVQDALVDDEIAVEIYTNPSNGTKMYIGIVLAKTYRSPLVIKLFKETDVNPYWLDGEFDCESLELYKAVWRELGDRFIQKYGFKTIYIAADGILNSIPFEALVDENGVLASEKWDIYRLSSIREILREKIGEENHMRGNVSVLYGGLDYSSEISVHMDVDKSPVASQRYYTNRLVRHIPDSLRSLGDYLPGSLVEVENISQMLKTHNCDVITYTHHAGDEGTIPKLNGKDIMWLHFSTHGFFLPRNQVEKHATWNFLKGRTSQAIEDPLLRCGLLLSGAKKTLQEGVQSNIGDGILLGAEVAQLDLSNVNLVTLSACETGLGETTVEGIFGLQRGFKLAGVKSLLVSLWKVPDEATQMLMTEFYQQLLLGKRKIDALRIAQNHVRQTPGKRDFSYWAGFVLVDAID